jgi:hypothetical protein
MPNTTSTSVTELINTEAIDALIIPYQYDVATAVPFFRYKSMSGEAAAVASFPRWVKDTHEDVATESTSLTTNEMETTDVQVTVARVGIAREVSETSLEDNILGRARFMEELVMDSAVLIGEAKDEDATAQFANATGLVTDTGQDLEILDLVEAIGTQRANKARGPQVFHLHDVQLKDLQRQQAAATATTWASFYSPNADGTEYGGTFMGAPIFASSKNPTANAGADRVGCLFSQGQDPVGKRFCAFAFADKRAPTTKFDEDILEDTQIMVTTTRYGVGTVAANFATRIVTDA